MAEGTRRRTLTAPALATALPAAAAAAASLALAGLVLKVWNADFGAPFAYQRDAIQNLMLVKNTLEQGWPLHTPLLGAPFGQDLYDFPVVAGDVVHLLAIKAIGLFSDNPATVMNVFYLLQFPLAALAALWAFRRLGVATWPAVACAVLFALAPYHFYRGEIHVFLAGYWSVPLGMYLVLSQFMGRPIGWRTLIVLGVIVGTSEVYYAVMTLLLLAVALAVSLARPNRRELLRTGALATAVILAVLAVEHAPTILYHADHGQNSEIQKSRNAEQSEIFGMRIARLALPVDGHRVAPLASITDKYNHAAPSQLDDGPPQALGTIATAGFLALLGVTALALLPGDGRRPDPLLQAAAAATLAAVLIGVVGGFSGVISYLISHTVRSWNRYSIFIGFAALVPIAFAMTRARVALAARGTRPAVAGFLLALVVVLAAYDHTGTAAIPKYDVLREQWNIESDFVHAVQMRLPNGAEVFQAPYVPFPETGYEPARPYLHSSSLRWSFGAMEGRPADWSRALVSQPGAVVVPSVAAAGFSGLSLDRGLYPDHGAAASADLQAKLGAPLTTSTDGRMDLYDLRPYAGRVATALGPQSSVLGQLTLHPPRAAFGPGFGPAKVEPRQVFALDNQRWSDGQATWIDLTNPQRGARQVRMQMNIAGLHDGRLTFQFPDRTSTTVRIGAFSSPFDRLITLPPGTSRIHLSTDIKPDQTRPDLFGFQNFRLIDEQARLLAIKAARAA